MGNFTHIQAILQWMTLTIPSSKKKYILLPHYINYTMLLLYLKNNLTF